MRSLTPWRMTSLKKEMDRLFDSFADIDWGETSLLGEWAPSVDVSETGDAIVVKAEVPGMESKDLEISLQGHVLTLKGEKKQEKEEKDERRYRIERSYGAFTRRIRLPVAVDESKVTATFKNGLLTVTLPKTAAARGTPIPIKAD